MGWQCDVQVANGGLRKAFSRFRLFQEGEAAARLLAHISDLKKTAVTSFLEQTQRLEGVNFIVAP